ncbi:MAG TPA: flagellar basal body rod C-terminal domain-containing protein, partial [Spirochaetota bacterium]|nr:flagellar basal body rod C-terminal domain-containing protein [Spirochaetota bacterium]
NYNETDTLEQVIKKINDSGARVSAFLNPENRLTIKADYQLNKDNPDFVIQRLEDNGLFLTGYAGILKESGQNGAYNYQTVNQVDQLRNDSLWSVAPLVNPSAYMKVEDKIIADNSFIATASGVDIDGDGVKDKSNGIGDSENAQKISSLKTKKVMVGMSLSFTSYFEYVVSDIGSRGREAEKGFKAAETIVQNLENMRKSISGVNIDEEFANLIKFQHGYNAVAKVISTMDKMLETLMMKLG